MLAHQIGLIVMASEVAPDLGFMARLMALCSLPRTNPGRRKEYVRRNGLYTLVMSPGGLIKLPYGNLPRLLMAWVSTEAVRTRRRELVLGRSLSEFMRKVGIFDDGGALRCRMRTQIDRLVCPTWAVSIGMKDPKGGDRINLGRTAKRSREVKLEEAEGKPTTVGTRTGVVAGCGR